MDLVGGLDPYRLGVCLFHVNRRRRSDRQQSFLQLLQSASFVLGGELMMRLPWLVVTRERRQSSEGEEKGKEGGRCEHPGLALGSVKRRKGSRASSRGRGGEQINCGLLGE